MGILPVFSRYPDEGRIVGQLVTGWGELEFGLAHCISQITNDADMTFKVMFRARGESNRIVLADALARSRLTPGQHLDFYDRTLSGLKVCLKIRNQYAHSNWLDDPSRGLLFVALEEIVEANAPVDLGTLSQHPAPLALLEEQERFFEFIGQSLDWLNFEAQILGGRIKQNPFSRPKGMNAPDVKLPRSPHPLELLELAIQSKAPK